MADADELVALFHSMDNEAKEYVLATARSQAKRYPLQRPALRLVAGQLGNGAFGSEPGSISDVGTPAVG